MAGASGRAAAAAAGAGLHGVHGAAGRHAGLVVGGLRAPSRRLPRFPQERAAPARRQPAGRRRLHQPHAAPRQQHAPARLADHHRCAQVYHMLHFIAFVKTKHYLESTSCSTETVNY